MIRNLAPLCTGVALASLVAVALPAAAAGQINALVWCDHTDEPFLKGFTAKTGIKVGVTVAGVAGSAARNVARTAAEAAESFVDLVAEAKSEMEDAGAVGGDEATAESTITKVTVD